MKRFLFLNLLLLLGLRLYSQVDTTKADSTRLFGTQADEFKKYIPNYSPLPPNTAAIQKYGNYNVNLATGVPDISIPLYTAQDGDLSIPIVLRYHASGHRIDELAPWVGWGFNLDVGGAVNRNINAIADDKPISTNYLNNPILSRDLCNSATDYSFMNVVENGSADTQPDLFTYSSPVSSGKFMLRHNGLDPFLMPWQPHKISYGTAPNGTINSFDVINESGQLCRFGKYASGSTVNEYQSILSTFGLDGAGIVSWPLTQILSPNNNDKIELFYQDGGSLYQSSLSYSATINYDAGGFPPANALNPDASVQTRQNTQLNIQKITFINGEVEFVKSTSNRLDLLNGFSLDSIKVFNYENGLKHLIKVFKFHYSYFTDRLGNHARLKLDSLSIFGMPPLDKQTYKFHYTTPYFDWFYKEGASFDMSDLAKVDYFGYFNKQNNAHTLDNTYNGVSWTGGLANRNTDETYLKQAVLNKITYPAGGYSTFEFEANKILRNSIVFLAGGLKIKAIKNYLADGSLTNMKRYELSTDDGLGVGKLTTSSWGFPATGLVGEVRSTNGFNILKTDIISPDANIPGNAFDSSPVYYTTAKVFEEENADPLKNGRMEHTFGFEPDINVSTPFVLIQDIEPWKRGQEIKQESFTADSTLIFSKTTAYQNFKSESINNFQIVKLYNNATTVCEFCTSNMPFGFGQSDPEPTVTNVLSTFPCPYPRLDYLNGSNKTGALRPTQITEIRDGVSSTTAIHYDANLFTDTTTTENSISGHFYQDINIFPTHTSYDSDGVALALKNRNIISAPLETKIRENLGSAYTSIFHQKTVYNTFLGNNARALANNILPAEIWVAPTGQTLEKRVEFKNYDDVGNVLDYEVDGQPSTLLWGYGHSLVLAVAKNTTLAQMNTALSSTGLSAIAFSVNSLSAGQETTLLNFQNALPNALVDFYTHRPRIGLSQSFAPNSLKTSYFYDGHQRLNKITDHEGNILQTHFYKINTTENYISTAKPRIATTSTATAGVYTNALLDYQFYDGLGRPTQAIGIGQSPEQHSLIKTEVTYDKYGRAIGNLLSVSAGALTYSPVNLAKSLAQSFYADAAPIDSTIYEASPLNRLSSTFGVGQAWRMADKKTQTYYEAGGLEVRNYELNAAGNIILNGNYPNNSLYKNRTLDEQGHETIAYTDKRGRTVEKRQQLEKGVYAHTHYIYDGLGRIKAIIQPEGYELNTGFNYNETDFQNWIFLYEYDSRGRVVKKYVPAAGFTKMIYDKKDRLVMQQDALQATLDKWNFMKYDAFDREVFKGETTNTNSQMALQSAFDTFGTPDEVWGSGGYSGTSFPSIANPTGAEVQHYTFYDQYDFLTLNANLAFDSGNSYQAKHSSAKGLQTGSVSYNLADHNQYFMTASYFDTKNRPIQSFETHILSPILPNRSDIEYNFIGEVLKNRMVHKKIGSADIVEIVENEYDHVGRATKTFHSLNGLKIEIARNDYDPVSRLTQKKIKPGFNYKSGISDIIIRNSEPPINTQDYVRRNIQLLPGFAYCPDSLAPSLYLGQVDTLGLGGTTDALQTIDYSYNIRNGLRCINCINDDMSSLNKTQNDLFGMKLDFHETGIWYDGNIQKQSWIKANDNILRNYTYGYDASSRLKSAIYQSPNNEDFSLPNMAYDNNGNILNLNRKANIAGGFGMVDSLSYFYSGNKLLKVEDVVIDTSKNYFNHRNTVGNDFDYYSNGNLKKDLNENITQINYNTFLNQPIEVLKSKGSWEKSFYDGSGHLVQRTNSLETTWTYTSNIIYKNDTLYQIGTPEGRIIQDTSGNFHYQFEYRDLTGNLRLLYQDPTVGNPAIRMAPEIVQSQDYEPFGVGFNEYFGGHNNNKFGYSNHEIVNDLRLNRIDFGNRTYNPTYGRFDKIDFYSDIFEDISPYTFVYNAPLINIDMYGDSTVPVKKVDWKNFDVNNDEILFDAITIKGSTDVGSKVAPIQGYWDNIWNGNRTSADGREITRGGIQTKYYPANAGTIPDIGAAKVGTIYTAVKKGLPYVGKTFNILKRYSKSERFSMNVTRVIKDISGNNKLIRAIEQKAIEYKKTIGEIANKRNAFNPKRSDYQKYMQEAETWLNKNLPDWKNLLD